MPTKDRDSSCGESSEGREAEGGGTVLGFNKNIFFAGLVSFLTDTSTKMVYSIMPLF